MQFVLHRLSQNSEILIDGAPVPVYAPMAYDTAILACKFDLTKQILWIKFDWQDQPFEFTLKPGIFGIGPADSGLAQIYPNPAKDLLWIEWGNDPGPGASVQIMDINGRKISTTRYNRQFSTSIIDVSFIKPGLYLVRFNAEKWTKVLKLIKQ